MPNGIDILQLNTVTSTSNADKLYVHQGDTLVQVTKSNFMSEINNNIADEYDSTSTYTQGDYCMYNGQLYVCNTTISTSEEWNSSHWTSTTCADGFNVNGIPMSEKGSANGVAELDDNGKVPTSQLPSYVDDVLEYSSLSAFPSTGETGKIYIALDTNLSYRWSGTVYVEISPSLALGETSSTAYRGDRGATAYTHSQTTSGNPHNVTKSDVGLGNVENFKAVSTEASQGLTSAEQSNAKDNLGLSTVATSGSYTDLINKPTIDTALDTSSTNAVQNKAIAHELAGGNTQASGDVITITDGSDLALTSATSTILPIQNLHGYSYPWVGGASKNIFDFESWLTARNVTYTKSGNAYTFNVSSLVGSSGAWTFSDTPINVTLTASINNVTSTNVGFRLKNDTDVSARGNNITMTATTVYLDWSTTGQVTIEEPMIRLATVTDATYAPYSNVCPISGYDSASYNRCGVNQWDEQVELGYYDSTGTFQSANNRLCTKNKIKVNPQNTYYCKLPLSSSLTDNFIICYDKNEEFLQRLNISNSGNGFSFTTPNNCYYINVNFTTIYTGGTTYNHDISINYPSTITTYQPYQGQSVTLTFDNTVYSGTIDWVSGVVIVNKVMIDLGDLTWAYENPETTSNKSLFRALPSPLPKAGSVCISSNYRYIQGLSNMVNGACTISGSGQYVYIRIMDERYTNATTFKTAVTSVQLLYELATPTTITLTPTQLRTLAGYNTIYTDVGNISIAYQPNNVIAECKEYTDKAIPTVDSELNDTSLNPIANKPVAEAIADIVSDISDIDSSIEGSKQLTTTGDVITVSDSATTYLEELEADIEPIQDLHGYDYPWVGGAGKNILPINQVSQQYNTGITCNIPAGTYTLSYTSVSGIGLACRFYYVAGDNDQSIVLADEPTITFERDVVSCNITITNYTVGATVSNIQLELGNQATSYEPYSNICPISGYDECNVVRTGKNVFDENNNKNLVTTHAEVSPNGNYYINKIKVKPNTQYTLSQRASTADNTVIILMNNVPNVNSVAGYLDLRLAGDTKTITSSNDGYLYIGVFNGGSPTDNAYNARLEACQVQIEEGNQATSYAPYQGQTYTVEFKDNQDQSMTVYSGQLDVTTGVLTVDKAMVDLGNLSWYKSGSTGNQYFYTTVADAKPTPNNVTVTSAICTDYRAVSVQNFANTSYGFSINTTKDVSVKDGRYISLLTNEFKTAVTGVQLIYELATPQVIHLNPTQLQMLKGNNTVTTDANGGMTLRYQPDNVVGDIKAYASRLYNDIIRRLNELSS